MRYRVTYRKRFGQQGDGSDSPESTLDVADGVILESEFVERFEPDNLHGEEEMDEDDDFLPFGSEVWEYEISPSHAQEFKNAVARSGVVMEIDRIDDHSPAIDGQ